RSCWRRSATSGTRRRGARSPSSSARISASRPPTGSAWPPRSSTPPTTPPAPPPPTTATSYSATSRTSTSSPSICREGWPTTRWSAGTGSGCRAARRDSDRDAVSVPVVDLAPARRGGAERLRVAAAIDAACREIGFFAIDGHGVPARVVDQLRAVAHAFFALPREDKLAARHPVAGTNRGYHPAGGEALSSANDAPAPPDLKEFFHVGPVDVGSDAYYTSAEGCRHFTPNVWPAAPPDFERAATVYYRAMSELVPSLMRLAALALSVDETFFDDKVDRSVGTMRLNYYPAQARLPTPGQLRAGDHTDYGGMTIQNGRHQCREP